MINFIKTMAPGWFAGVMGTSVASLAAWLLFAATPWQWVADALHYIAIVMMIVLVFSSVNRHVAVFIRMGMHMGMITTAAAGCTHSV